MEKTNVPYEAWPERVKILSAAYIKAFILKNPKTVRHISYLSFFVGFLLLFQIVYYWHADKDVFERKMDFGLIYLSLLNILLGFWNYFITYKLYTWINENSSWEERFGHSSSSKHKFQYFLIFVGIFVVPWLITCLSCC